MFSSCSDWDNCIIPSNNFYNDNVYNDSTNIRPVEGASVNCYNRGDNTTNCGCGGACVNSGECGEMLPTPHKQQQYVTTSNQLNEASSLSATAAATATANDYESLSETSEESINFNDNNNYNNIYGNINSSEMNPNNRNSNLDNNFSQNNNTFNENNTPYNNNNTCEQNTRNFNNLNLNNNHFNQNNNTFNQTNNNLTENNSIFQPSSNQFKQNLNVLNTNCGFNSNNNHCNTLNNEFNESDNGFFENNTVCSQNNNIFNEYNKNSFENNNFFNINCNFNQVNNICNQNNNICNQINKNLIENNNQCYQTQNSCQQNNQIFNTNNNCIQNNNILNVHSKENTILNKNTNNNNNNFISPVTERHHPYRYNSDNNHYYNNYQQKLQLQHKTQQFSTYHGSNFMNQNHNFVNTTQPQMPQPQFQQQQLSAQQQKQQQLVLYNTRAFANATPPPPLEHYTSTYQSLAPAPTHLHTSPSFTGPPRMLANNYYRNHQGIQAYDQQHFNAQQPQLSSRAPSIPCQGNQPWTYAYCYGYGAYSNQGPCQFTQIVDIEDFMNNEKRKERSRDAARCRRSRETEIFTELAQVLPLKKEDVQQLDKASVMRIAIAYLKVRDMLKMFPRIQELLQDLEIPSDNTSNNNNSDNYDDSSNGAHISSIDLNDSSTQSSQNSEEESSTSLVCAETKPAPALSSNPADMVDDFGLMLKHTLDGFLLILSNDGDITYVTGNIADYLGISKIDILGQQIWEYAHQCDHAELKEALNIKRNGLAVKVKDENLLEEGLTTDHRDLFVRLKCTLTSRGRSINIKSASYKVIHITGHLVVNAKGDRVLVAMGRPIPHPSNIEIPLGTTTFLTKHSLDMKFTYVDDKMYNLLGYKPEDLLETSLFNCHHGIDSESLMTTFKNVLSKGQGETCRYRFLGKYGGYCWIVTQATIVYDKLKPQSVVCVNFVVSNLEKKYEIYTLQQFEESQKLKELEEKPTTTATAASNNNTGNQNNNNKTEVLNENKLKAEEIIKDHNKTTEDIQKQIITADSAEAATTKIENSTPPPTPLNNNNNNNNKINEDIIQLNTIIKQEQQIPPAIVNNKNKNYFNKNKIILPTTTISATATTTISIPAAVVKPTNYTPPPQQPLLPTHCPTTTVTHTVFSKSKSSPSIPDDKGPKTVTSSLILTSLPTTTSTQSILHQLPLNVATRAQSVTATVFSPLPETPNKSSTINTATAEILRQSLQEETEGDPQTTQETNIISQHQDMNKGFLSFAEDATELTMLKEEPDDLTAHLVATNAVDACMPLDESGPLFGEILVGFGMSSYGSLLTDDINSLDSNTSSPEQINTNSNSTALKASSSCNTNSCSSSSLASPTSSVPTYNGSAITATSTHRQSSPSLITTTACATTNSNTTAATTSSTNIDPFINYRDESNDTNCSQHLLSPSVTSKSPEGSSLPSLCSPNSLSQEDEFPYYTMNVDDMDDLTMRAPYIPMNEQDDLPLLTSDDYMWSSGNAFTPDEFSLHTKDSDNGLQAMQINQSMNYQQQQFTQQQAQQFSNSLCSSPASTVSSMSPSPIQQQQQQQQQQNSQQIFSADSSELAALLCGSGNSSLSILQDTTNFTNSLNLNGGGGSNQDNTTSQTFGTGDNSVGLNDDLDSVSVASPTAASPALDQHQQLQQQCLQQFQEQLQQQRQQQLLSGLNINCKKEKFDTANNSPSMTPNLCDTIDDAFDSVYSKNSTNLDCWNEFLQINTNENTNTTNNAQQQAMENLRQEDCKKQLQMQLQQQQQQQQQTQNIIINAVLINGTIQTTTSNNKNILVPTTLTTNQQQQQSNTKSLNKVNAIKFTPITSTATKIIENKQTLLQQQQQQQQQNNIIKTAYIQAAAATQSNNKRHLSATQIANNAMEAKRLKSNNVVMDLQNSNTTSQLLQQLITNPQQQGNLNGKNSKTIAASRWSSSNENQNQQQQQQQQQQQKQQQQKQSNSVLKNLLISGCDKTKMEILTLDDNSRSSMQSPDLCLSSSMTRPLQCVTAPSNILRSYRHNPWIGGPGVLPSPTNALISGEECSTTYSSCDNTIDSVSDSGIDDASIAENVSPLKRTYEQQTAINNLMINNLHIDNNTTNMTNSNKIEENVNIIGQKANLLQEVALSKKILAHESEDEGASMSKRKRSISFLDSNNPLMTPFLMDLCNDDYHMNAKEYLQENDIENVLNEWSVNLV